MHLHGIVQSAELAEDPAGEDRIELILRVQGVGAGQPRRIIVPFEILLQDETLDPESVQGRAFQAEVAEEQPKRWVVEAIGFGSSSILRRGD